MRSQLLILSFGCLLSRISVAQALPRLPLLESSVAILLEAGGLTVQPGELRLPPHLSTTVSNPVLQIRGASLLPDGQLQLRLGCVAARECLPFYATIRMPDPSAALPSLALLTTRSHPGAASSQPSVTRAMLRAGAQTTLVIQGDRMQLKLPVVSLDAGDAGSEVRVASLDRRQTYRGVVVDANLVRGGVQ